MRALWIALMLIAVAALAGGGWYSGLMAMTPVLSDPPQAGLEDD